MKQAFGIYDHRLGFGLGFVLEVLASLEDPDFKMPTLAVTNFNIVLSVLGGWISLFGLVSYLCKESYYMSEACKFIPQISNAPDYLH